MSQSQSSDSSVFSLVVASQMHKAQDTVTAEKEVGEKLVLTPWVQRGDADMARNLSRVQSPFGVLSHAAFLNVRQDTASNLFFWFVPAAQEPETAPVIVWLQGGPGHSSLFGLFVEHGPLYIDCEDNTHLRQYPWTLRNSVIYIDSPVGVGFSHTGNDTGYATSQDDVANDLYEALLQFFTIFPDYVDRDFYVSGESYGGKYGPSLAYKIHQENAKGPKIKINLQGVTLGAGFTDPLPLIDFGEFLYNIGLVDIHGKAHFDTKYDEIKKLMEDKKWMDVYTMMDELLHGDLSSYPTYFRNTTGLNFYFNYLQSQQPKAYEKFVSYLNRNETRKTLHVGQQPYYYFSDTVMRHLREDMYQSVKDKLETILNAGYRVLLYASQLDVVVPAVNLDKMIQGLEWTGKGKYAKAERKIWHPLTNPTEVAGWVKTAGNLVHVVIRDAGHVAPYDKPEWTFDMINRFTRREAF